ncbi:hypothetical protein HW932_20600 [Allochromatium humboldtianum]|uniref:Uncharacterized protein n=1 Tax=Allochromatium humboldtianum TaxID=504901 RepID=A0A850RA79_9GAMM|nr:hypothetical protein [Allochromatium humboldtianum]NVZ11649.1 hypothetical protein [Allochromatium humboldtianum]
MQNTTPFTLTEHAQLRLSERTSIHPDEIDAVVQRGIQMKYPGFSTHAIRLFWSEADTQAYLAIHDRETRRIITILPAYAVRPDGVIRWKSYTDHGIGRSDLNFSSHVKPRHILKCLKKAGAPIPPILYRAGVREAVEKPEQPPKGYTINLRYRMIEDDYPPVRVLKRLTADQSLDDVETQELYALAREMLGEALGSVVEAGVEFKAGRNNAGVGRLLFEIDLDVEHLRGYAA